LTRTSEPPATRIDAIMDKASKALVERRYFEAERLAVEALESAHHEGDFERMGRICLPLQEARRQKRDQAAATGEVFIIDDQLPKPGKLRAGCYLVRPPRVGLDGRMLREMIDRREVPAIVVVREPTTRTGLWPVVALGPVTIRAQVNPPEPSKQKKKPRKSNSTAPDELLPDPQWFLTATEQLGDAAINSADPTRGPISRVEDLLLRLQALPDHEKLHQALMAACEEAAKLPEKERRARPSGPLDELDEEAGEAEDGDDDPV
jgi:hypothetical protein